MVEHLHDRLRSLAPPAIRADDRRKPHLGPECICKVRCRHDLGVRSEEHGWRCNNDGSCIYKREGKFPDIRMGQVERSDGNTAGNQGIGEVFHHLPGAAMHGHVGNHHLVFHGIGNPVCIGIENQVGIFVYRAVARGNQVDFKGTDLFEMAFYTAAERHHDLGIIPLCGDIKVCPVGIVEVACRHMVPEQVAGEEDPVFPQVGDLRLGPVGPRRKDELEGPVTQRQGFPVLDDPELFRGEVEQGDEQVPALLIGHHLGIREEFEDHREGTGMVLLGMVDNDVVDAFDPQLDKVGDQVELFCGINSVNQCGLFAATD